MNQLRITPASLYGTVAAVPSKSDTHRAVICALLSKNRCRIHPVDLSMDIRATIGAAEAFGAVCAYENRTLTIDAGNAFAGKHFTVDCGESGSTLRFLLPVSAAMGCTTEFTGRGRLPQRPIDLFYTLFQDHGATMSAPHLPLTISGRLQPGHYTISGNVSSQFITGLLLTLPLLPGDSVLTLSSPLQSSGYVDLTLQCMQKFGVHVAAHDKYYVIPGNQQYICADYTVEGDWSQAAFFLAAGATGGDVTVSGLSLQSVQGDKHIFGLLRQFGADIQAIHEQIRCVRAPLSGIDIDASQIPDLVPALAVIAAFAEGETNIYNAARLRRKESDRIQTTCDALQALGCRVQQFADGMKITGTPLTGGMIDCCNDHRIAMSMSVAASGAQSGSVLQGYSCVQKSYPDFFKDFQSIGGQCDVIDR